MACLVPENITSRSLITADQRVRALVKNTEVKSSQLDQEIPREDLHIIAGCFDNYNVYLDKLGLDPGQCADIAKTELVEKCNQSAMREALRCWIKTDPSVATFRTLLEIVLSLGRHDVAHLLCKYIVETIPCEDAIGNSEPLSEPHTPYDPEDGDNEIDGNCHKNESDSSTDSLNLYQAIKDEPELPTHKKTFTLRERDLTFETLHMRGEFAGLVTNVAMTMERQGVTVANFVLFLSQIKAVDAVLKTAEQPCLLFNKQFVAEVQTRCSTVGEVFMFIDGYYSWFNYLLFEKIIKTFCKHDEDITERLKEYLRELEGYCKNRLCKVPQNGFNFSRRKNSKQIVFKIDEEWEEMRIETINTTTVLIAKILKLNRVLLCLRTVNNGCVELTYDIPEHVTISLTKSQQVALQEHGIRYIIPEEAADQTKQKACNVNKPIPQVYQENTSQTSDNLYIPRPYIGSVVTSKLKALKQKITTMQCYLACDSDTEKITSTSSVVSCDAGYDDIESTRTSYSFLDLKTMPENLEEINSSRCSACSSEYETAHTSLESLAAMSVDSETLVAPEATDCNPTEEHNNMHGAALQSARMPKSTEQDDPHHRPPLQTSQSMDCPPTKKKPVLRRQSRTEKQFSSEDLQKALAKALGNRTFKELDEKHEALLKQTMRDRAADFRQYTDFSILHAHLVEEHLVNASESEFLNKECYTHTEKANKFFFEILERKGPTAYRTFYYALRAEKQHKGHEHLVELFDGALVKLELTNQ